MKSEKEVSDIVRALFVQDAVFKCVIVKNLEEVLFERMIKFM